VTSGGSSRRRPAVSLRLLALLTILVPVLVYGAIGVFRYLEASKGAEQRVSRSLRVAHEHATKVLGSAESLHERLFDLVDGKTLAELRTREAGLHKAFREKVREQSQVHSIWIIGPDGRAVASSLSSPPPGADYSDREYFKHHEQGRGGRFLSAPFLSRASGHRILDLSIRFNGADGTFGGVINISLHNTYFESFYADLVRDEPGLAINLFRVDGPIYARWPLLPNPPQRMGDQSPTLQRVRAGAESGTVRGISSVDNRDRLISFQKVGSYPLFVGAGMDISALRAEVFKELAILLALGLPPFVAIFLAARVAMRRASESYEAAERLEAETLTRRKAEEALLQAQKLEALGRLTGGVAHDFNNALMVISNNAFLLERQGALNDKGAAQLKSISRAVESATKLTRQLLAFSRRQALVPEHVDLRSKLPAARALLSPVLGSQIDLTIEVHPDTLPITVDMAELELALLNLAINARDAMGTRGSFMVTAKNSVGAPEKLNGRSAVVIEATDTGSGIEPGVLNKVFEPFFTTKPIGQGTGLGLSQVYGLCERAGGVATIRSRVGAGTTVGLYFPATHTQPIAVEESRSQVRRDLGKTVLLVEDNDEVSATLVPVLDALGCRVFRVASAAAALEWLSARAAAPDLVLSDVVMPGDMDGLGLATHLRASHPTLRVILMTGYAERLDSIERQGFDVLPKPCSAEILAAAIARAGRQAQASRGQERIQD
jgi:signal transduction histidine kinase/ActR/RegA family two-component response regulator